MRISIGTSKRAGRSALLLLALAACAIIWRSPIPGTIQAASPAAELNWNWDRNSARYGPANWKNISEPCGVPPQSPINFTARNDQPVGEIEFKYSTFNGRVARDADGYKFEVKVPSQGQGGGIVIRGTFYELTDFHLHTMSEHTFGNQYADLEVHLVHKGPDSSLAVVGVLMDKVGSGGNGLVSDMITNASQPARDFSVNPRRFVTPGVRYYSYRGSLTTPTCGPVAHWMVLASPRGQRPTVNDSDLQSLQGFIRGFSINKATGSTYRFNHRPVETNPVEVQVYASK